VLKEEKEEKKCRTKALSTTTMTTNPSLNKAQRKVYEEKKEKSLYFVRSLA
jgi:hypothetical protein